MGLCQLLRQRHRQLLRQLLSSRLRRQNLLPCRRHLRRRPSNRSLLCRLTMAMVHRQLLSVHQVPRHLRVYNLLLSMSCLGASTVYRFSLSLLIIFLILCLVMICRNRIARVINEGLFFIKYLIIVGIFIGFLFVNNTIFLSYGEACKGLGIVYMLIQVNDGLFRQ